MIPIPDKAALIAALDARADARAIARHGVPVVQWALEIAADSSGASPAMRRAGALRVLGYARWKPAMATLVSLATPLLGDWVVWKGALDALANYPYIELAPLWSDLLGFPRRVVRETALRGIALTGAPHDLPRVRDTNKKEEDPHTRANVAAAESLLRLPLSVRDTARFRWPPDSVGGRFSGCAPASGPPR